MKKNQRRFSGLVVHRMQREIGMLVVVVLMMTTLSVAFLIHTTLESAMTQSGSQLSGGAIETLYVFKRILLDRIFLSLIAGILVIAFVVMKMLHRAAGPLDRIARTLRALSEGESPKEIVLRKDDYFVELAETVNGVIKFVDSGEHQKKRKGSA